MTYGNIIAYKNSNGNTVAAYSYDPFGNVISHTGMDFTYKFSTKPQDDLSGMYYYGYRFYQPTLGRWINRDPIRENGGRNLYSNNNNLVSSFDILGLFSLPMILENTLNTSVDFFNSTARTTWEGTKWIGNQVQNGVMWTWNGIKWVENQAWNGALWVWIKVDGTLGFCGSTRWERAFILDTQFDFNFGLCCDKHDECYDTPGSNRKCCDKKFLKCMKDVVKDKDKWYKLSFLGNMAADIFYFAVDTFGQSAFDDAQKNPRKR